MACKRKHVLCWEGQSGRDASLSSCDVYPWSCTYTFPSGDRVILLHRIFSTKLGRSLPSLAVQAAVAIVSHWEAEETNFEGLRVKVDEGEGSEGWLMNRMSLHEPIVIFNVESVRPASESRRTPETYVFGVFFLLWLSTERLGSTPSIFKGLNVYFWR